MHFIFGVGSVSLQHDNSSNDPFNWSYLFGAVAVLLALPLMHVILGWLVFYL